MQQKSWFLFSNLYFYYFGTFQKETNTDQPMLLRSHAILEPCGLDMFRGVEFVCCPKELEERIEKVVDLETTDKSAKNTAASTADEDDDDDDENDDDDDVDDEEYSEEGGTRETGE